MISALIFFVSSIVFSDILKANLGKLYSSTATFSAWFLVEFVALLPDMQHMPASSRTCVQPTFRSVIRMIKAGLIFELVVESNIEGIIELPGEGFLEIEVEWISEVRSANLTIVELFNIRTSH